jgi:hypothetical protein
MNIVVEGPDNSGKSTLVAALNDRIGFPVIAGKGPCTPNTWGHRFHEFDGEKCVIFDRHACVSEPIYSLICRDVQVPRELTRRFYATKSIFVYCRNVRGLEGHIVNHKDTPEHLELLKFRHRLICNSYDAWAAEHAHIIYRIGDDKDRVAAMIEAAL